MDSLRRTERQKNSGSGLLARSDGNEIIDQSFQGDSRVMVRMCWIGK